MAAVVAIAVEQPARGQARVAKELRQRGIEVSPLGVRNIWLRHDLARIKHRLKALEAKMAQEGGVLMETQPSPRFGDSSADLHEWTRHDNEARIHQGRWCFGKTPMQTFLDSRPHAHR